MSEPCQVPQIPVEVDLRKVMTPEKEERLRHAREVRAKNRIMIEEKRMEVAKQFLLASAAIPAKSAESASKTSPEEKKLKWEARKDSIIEELLQKIGEANTLAREKSKESVPELERESEFSDMEEPPAKRQKKEKKPKKSKPAAVPKPSKTKNARKSSSSTAANTYERGAKRKPVKPAMSESESESTEDDSSETSEVEQEHVLKLWSSLDGNSHPAWGLYKKYREFPDGFVLVGKKVGQQLFGLRIYYTFIPIGMGKSTVLIRLTTEDAFSKGKFRRILIFSPTFFLDQKWTNVLNVKGVLKRSSYESTEETIDLVAPRREKKRFTGRVRPEDVHTEYSEEVLEELVEEQKGYREMYGKAGTPDCLIIFEAASQSVLGKNGDSVYSTDYHFTPLQYLNLDGNSEL